MLVLITGASGGLGYELANYFHKNGDDLILIARQSSVHKLQEKFSSHTIAEIDFFNDDAIKILSRCILTKLPDIIIHCAGGKIEGDNHPINIDLLKKTMDINLNNAININNYFIDAFKKHHVSSRIIHISSNAGLTGRASPCYSIAKGALHTYIKNIGRVYAKDNIMICGIMFGIFEHENSEWTKKKIHNKEYYKKTLNSHTMQRFPDAKEIAEVVVGIALSKTMLYSAEIINATAGNT